MTLLIIGAAGYFGSRLADDLARHAGCRLILAGRHPARLPTTAAERRRIDLSDPASIGPALEGVEIALCAAGPYRDMPLTLLEACLERKIHYIDLADDRDFVLRARRRGQGAPAAVCPGWSTVSALSGALASIAASGLKSVDSIHIQMAPGNRSPRSAAVVASLLASAGRPIALAGRAARGWSEPRTFVFPAPIGPRTGYLVDAADHELLPALFDARRVEFRVGAEFGFFNRFLAALAPLPVSAAPFLAVLMRLTGFLGTSRGAVGVEVSGDGRARRACVTAERGGERIAVMPAAIMASLLASGECSFRGLVPLNGWVSPARLKEECGKRGFKFSLEDHGLG